MGLGSPLMTFLLYLRKDNPPKNYLLPSFSPLPFHLLPFSSLPRRCLYEMGQTSHGSWKGIISPMLQEAESHQP